MSALSSEAPSRHSRATPAPRRVRALLYLADHAGASNREVGAAVGVADDGQVSRILRRLLDLGLAVNHNGGKDPGGPNAWHLTPAGMRAATAAARSSVKA
jgi:predicted transcriptional regulator